MLVNFGNCLLHQPLWQVTSRHLKVLLKTKLLGEIVGTVGRIWEMYLLVVSSRLKRKCRFWFLLLHGSPQDIQITSPVSPFPLDYIKTAAHQSCEKE